jgi:hypothetical protein
LFADSQGTCAERSNKSAVEACAKRPWRIETATGNIVHAFTIGAMVQVFLLAPISPLTSRERDEVGEAFDRAPDDGMPPDENAPPAPDDA